MAQLRYLDAAHNGPGDFLRISIELSGNGQELHEIYPALSALIIRDEGLRFAQPLGQLLSLRRASHRRKSA
jgi:hypothetical protein